MNNSFPCESTYKGYRLVAIDGCDLSIPLDVNDIETLKYNGPNSKPNSLYHINSAYDILNNRYIDMIITGTQHTSEQTSMCTMANRFNAGKAIFIADRNYATWNVIEHIKQSQQSFLIRSKDIHSKSSILRKFNMPDSEFDLDVEITLTSKNTKEIKSKPDQYRFISTSTTFDYIDSTQCFYPINFRAVRFKIDGKEEYESIITNLPRNTFPPAIIKKLYEMRWGIEVSFRHLKYSTCLKTLHSKKRNIILQEIWARVIPYNLSIIIIKKISDRCEKKNRKWKYLINITRAIHFIRDLTKRKGGVPPNVEAILSKELLPIRTNRSYHRNLRPQQAINFNYRFS